MKIMKTLEINMRIIINNENHRNPYENPENQENHRNQCENNENHENLRNT